MIDSMPNENAFVSKTFLMLQIHEISSLIINPKLYAANGSRMYLQLNIHEHMKTFWISCVFLEQTLLF